MLKGEKWTAEQCVECLPPAFPENEDALFIYSIVQDQFIMTFNGPIAIDQNSIHNAMELYEIEDRRMCFEKVLVLARYFIEELRDNQEK